MPCEGDLVSGVFCDDGLRLRLREANDDGERVLAAAVTTPELMLGDGDI